MIPPPDATEEFYAGTSGVDADGTYMSNDFDTTLKTVWFQRVNAGTANGITVADLYV
jgi:hypothetical protein